jgi:hypothetical protein
MAAFGDAATLTLRLGALSSELHREATDGGGDLPKMVELADQIAEFADGLATAFSAINQTLETSLSNESSVDAAEPALAALVVVNSPVHSPAAGDREGRTDSVWQRWANRLRALSARFSRSRRRGEQRSSRIWPAWRRPRRDAALVRR